MAPVEGFCWGWILILGRRVGAMNVAVGVKTLYIAYVTTVKSTYPHRPGRVSNLYFSKLVNIQF